LIDSFFTFKQSRLDFLNATFKTEYKELLSIMITYQLPTDQVLILLNSCII